MVLVQLEEVLPHRMDRIPHKVVARSSLASQVAEAVHLVGMEVV